MHITPEPYDGALVAVAADALKCFGTDIDRDVAGQLLRMWRHRGLLSQRETAAVLRRFPEPAVPAIPAQVDGFNPAPPRTARCGRCGLTTPLVAGRFTNHADAAGEHCGDSGRPAGAQTD